MDSIEDLIRYARPLSEEDFRKQATTVKQQVRDPNWLFREVARDQMEPWQGDVIPPILLPFVAADGEIAALETEAMLLSTTCDAVVTQDPFALLAPVLPVDRFVVHLAHQSQDQVRSRVDALTGNVYARYMYLPEYTSHGARYVDFSRVASVSTAHLAAVYAACDPTSLTRLSWAGWHFLSFKLSYYHTRPEDRDEVPRM